MQKYQKQKPLFESLLATRYKIFELHTLKDLSTVAFESRGPDERFSSCNDSVLSRGLSGRHAIQTFYSSRQQPGGLPPLSVSSFGTKTTGKYLCYSNLFTVPGTNKQHKDGQQAGEGPGG